MELVAVECCSRFVQTHSFFFLLPIVFVLIVLLELRRPERRVRRWWCSCRVCRCYRSSAWASEFPSLSDWYAELLRRSPTRTVRVHVLGSVVTANPANVEHLLRTRFEDYPKGEPFAAILGDLLGRGIFNADGDVWRFQRRLAKAELGRASVVAFAFRVISKEICSRLLPLLDRAASTNELLDLQDVFRRFAFDSICKISFGVDPACLELSLPVSEFAAAFDKASALSAHRAAATFPAWWKLKRLLNCGSERELRAAIRLVNELAGEVIRKRREIRASARGRRQDLLSRFMASVDDDAFLRDIVVSFLLAGRDTVASALTFFFMLLAQNPDVKSKIRDEVDRISTRIAGDDRLERAVASYEELRAMQYVQAAVHESLRLYPPVHFDSKFAALDDVLPDGTAVARGTRVTYHTYAMGRAAEAWGPDCGAFRPHRWLGRGGAFVPESPFKYPVFQGGFRTCVGKEVALLEMKAVVAAVTARFDLDAAVGAGDGDNWKQPTFAPGLTASLCGGLPVRVWRRSRLVT